MKQSATTELLRRAEDWSRLHRWERAELGRALRLLGWTYSEIQEVIPVPKGTLSYWCREIRLTPPQVDAIRALRPPGVLSGVPVDTQRKRRIQVERIREEARLSARDQLGDPFWVAGVVLYWAEGSKSRGDLDLANTDPRILRIFISWIRTYHDPDAEFALQLHLHEGNDDHSARTYWRKQLRLADARFYKSFIKPRGTGTEKTISKAVPAE